MTDLLVGKLAERVQLCEELLVLLRRAQKKARKSVCAFVFDAEWGGGTNRLRPRPRPHLRATCVCVFFLVSKNFVA